MDKENDEDGVIDHALDESEDQHEQGASNSTAIAPIGVSQVAKAKQSDHEVTDVERIGPAVYVDPGNFKLLTKAERLVLLLGHYVQHDRVAEETQRLLHTEQRREGIWLIGVGGFLLCGAGAVIVAATGAAQLIVGLPLIAGGIALAGVAAVISAGGSPNLTEFGIVLDTAKKQEMPRKLGDEPTDKDDDNEDDQR